MILFSETRNLRIQCKLCGLNSNDIFDAMKHERLHDKMKTQEKNRKPDIDVRSKQNKGKSFAIFECYVMQ